MNPPPISYHGGGNEIPPRQIQQHYTVSNITHAPGMNYQMHAFVPYGIPAQGYTRPVFGAVQPPPSVRHPNIPQNAVMHPPHHHLTDMQRPRYMVPVAYPMKEERPVHTLGRLPAAIPIAAAPSAALHGATMPSAALHNATMPSAAFHSAPIPSAAFHSAAIPSASLPRAPMPSASFPRAVRPSAALPRVVMPSAALPGVVMPNAALPGVVMANAALPGVVMPSAALPGAVMPTAAIAGAVRPNTVAGQDCPLDLSTKCKSDNTSTCDQPLDLSKATKERKYSSSVTSEKFANAVPTAIRSPLNQGFDPTDANELEQELANAPNNHMSINSLLQNHPVDDILYLHCARCTSNYGNVAAFKKHFRNSHGYMPAPSDVLIQSIKATKEYQASAVPSIPKRHCNYCGWQCDRTHSSLFTRHMKEHYEVTGCFYRCMHCQQEFGDPSALRQHIVQHSAIYQHICAYCCIAYAAEEQLASHMSTEHKMRYTSNKANLPIGMELSNPMCMPPVRHDLSPHVITSNTRNIASHSQTYADHMHSNMALGKMAISPKSLHRHSSPSAHTPFNQSPMQPGKPVMMSSPRHLEAKVSSPLASYKRSPGFMKSESNTPVAEAAKETLAPNNRVNMKTLLSNAVEQEFKTTDNSVSVAASASVNSTASYVRRPPPSVPLSGYESNAQQRAVIRNQQSPMVAVSAPVLAPRRSSYSPGCMDLSRKAAPLPPPPPPPPPPRYAQSAPAHNYVDLSKCNTMLPANHVGEMVGFPQHRPPLPVPPQYNLLPSLSSAKSNSSHSRTSVQSWSTATSSSMSSLNPSPRRPSSLSVIYVADCYGPPAIPSLPTLCPRPPAIPTTTSMTTSASVTPSAHTSTTKSTNISVVASTTTSQAASTCTSAAALNTGKALVVDISGSDCQGDSSNSSDDKIHTNNSVINSVTDRMGGHLLPTSVGDKHSNSAVQPESFSVCKELDTKQAADHCQSSSDASRKGVGVDFSNTGSIREGKRTIAPDNCPKRNSSDSKADSCMREHIKSGIRNSQNDNIRPPDEVVYSKSADDVAVKTPTKPIAEDGQRLTAQSSMTAQPTPTDSPNASSTQQCDIKGDTKYTRLTLSESSRPKNSPLNFQVNTSTIASGSDNVIGNIIDKVVKSSLGLSDPDFANQVITSKELGERQLNPKSNDGDVARFPVSDKDNNNGGAFAVSWAVKKESKASLEVDSIQAMSACRVLINPNSCKVFHAPGGVPQHNLKLEETNSTDSRHNIMPSYVTSNGVLDMTKKSTSTSAYSSQDNSDNKSCSSPKRRKIISKD